MAHFTQDHSNMYANVFGFLNLPLCDDPLGDEADVAVLGLPYDLAKSGRSGTPVVGGLSSNRALAVLRGLKDLDIVGMDIVEVAPGYDRSEVTALAAATLGLEYLYILAHKRG